MTDNAEENDFTLIRNGTPPFGKLIKTPFRTGFIGFALGMFTCVGGTSIQGENAGDWWFSVPFILAGLGFFIGLYIAISGKTELIQCPYCGEVEVRLDDDKHWDCELCKTRSVVKGDKVYRIKGSPRKPFFSSRI